MTSYKADFLTVATIDYLSQALVTLQSARANTNYANFHFFAIDASPDSIISLRAFLNSDYGWLNIFGPHDLRADKNLFLRSFEYFNPLELSCLAKYLGVAHVLESSITADICVYSDADIFFTGDPIPFLDEMTEESIMLTPHQFRPSTDNAEQEYLLYGWINAGFFAVKRGGISSQKILKWLINRISRRGFLAPSIGLYVDQAWLSFMPAIFPHDVFISRHPGFNVAYWNLHERSISNDHGVMFVDSQKLIFFHFSGYIGAGHNQLTKYRQSLIPEDSPLRDLCAQYFSALTVAEARVEALPSAPKMKICNEGIEKRILRGSILNSLSLNLLSSRLGIFSKIGMKIDLFLSRWTL